MDARRLTAVVLVFILLGSGIAPSITAAASPQSDWTQYGGAGEDGGTTAEPPGDERSNNSTWNNTSTEGLRYYPDSPSSVGNNTSAGSILGSAAKAGGRIITGMFRAIGGYFQDDIRTLVNWFNSVFLSTLAPGEISRNDLSTEITGVFAEMQDIRRNLLAPFTFALWVYMLVRMFYGGPERAHKDANTVVAIAVLMLVWDQLYPLIYHSADIIGLALAPSGEELTGSFSGLAKLALSIPLLTGIISYNVTLLFIGVLEVLARDMVLLFGAATIPFLYTLWKSRIPFLSTFGQLCVGVWMLMLLFQPSMAFSLRLGFMIDWAEWAGTFGLPGAVLSPLASIVALTIATIGVPVFCLASMYLGATRKSKIDEMGKKTSKKFRDKAKERGPDPKAVASSAHETVNEKRPNPVQSLQERRRRKQDISYDDSAAVFDASSEAERSDTARINLDYDQSQQSPGETIGTSSGGGSSDPISTPTYKMRGANTDGSSWKQRSQNIQESLDD